MGFAPSVLWLLGRPVEAPRGGRHSAGATACLPEESRRLGYTRADANLFEFIQAMLLEEQPTPQKTARRHTLASALRSRQDDSLSSMVVSYVGIRRAIGMSGLLLPILLGPVGWLVFGIEIQDNMSSYYHTALRDVFVGTLCAIGIFLFCYKGHDWIENWTANFGCAAALGVALLPLDENSDPLYQRSVVGYLHTISGGIFFLTLAFYSLFHFPNSRSSNDEQEPHEQQRDFVYRASGVVILLSLFAMGAYLFWFPHSWKVASNRHNVLFWLEWIALWAFAAAWLTKGRVIIADVAIDLMAVTQEHLVAQLSTDGKSRDETTNAPEAKMVTDSKVSELQDGPPQPHQHDRRKVDEQSEQGADAAVWTVRVLGTLCVIATLLPLIPTGFWFVRGWDFPRFQLSFVLTVLVLVTLFLRGHFASSREHLLWMAALVAACGWQWSHVVRFTPVWPDEVSSTVPSDRQMRLLVVNLDFQNTAHDDVASEIREMDPDVLVLIEVNQAWRDGLEKVRAQYKDHHEEIRAEGLGMCVWSKFPVESAETRYIVEDRRPSIWAKISHAGHTCNLVAVHPTPPGLDDDTGPGRRNSRVRDAELVLIAKEIAQRNNESWIVAGDFNDVAWSHTTRLFKRLSGLKDPRIGRSFMGTYHADYPLLRFPIDHVFLSDGFRVSDLSTYKVTGSDHIGVAAGVVAEDPDQGVSPEPEGDDEEEAKKIVDEGKDDAAQRDVLDSQGEVSP